MKRFMQNPYWWATVYTVILAAFAVFVILDAFFIPQAMRTMPDTASAQSDNATGQTITDVGAVDDCDTTNSVTSGVYTANSYVDGNMSVSITTERAYGTQVYIADIQLQSIEYLKTAFAWNTYGRNICQTTSAMAEAHDAVFAINGDYYGYRNCGFVLRNGILYRSSSAGYQALVIYGDGSFEVVSESATDAGVLLEQGAVQVFSFGPSLVSNAEIDVAVSNATSPRTAIGIISPLHYIVIVSDGRTEESNGLTLFQLATIFRDLGCETAYNLDGGGSSTMWFNGEIVNVPTDGRTLGERKLSDIVYVGY